MLLTHHFRNILSLLAFLFLTTFSLADNAALQDLENRLLLHPPSKDDYAPIIETVEQQLSAIRVSDYDRAYYYYTTDAFRQRTTYPDFQRFVKGNQVLINNKSISQSAVSSDKNYGYYRGLMTANDGTIRTIQYQLVIENGYWKIQSILFPKK